MAAELWGTVDGGLHLDAPLLCVLAGWFQSGNCPSFFSTYGSSAH